MLSHKIHFVFFTVLDCTPPFQVSVITDAKEDTITSAAQTVLSRGKKRRDIWELKGVIGSRL